MIFCQSFRLNVCQSVWIKAPQCLLHTWQRCEFLRNFACIFWQGNVEPRNIWRACFSFCCIICRISLCSCFCCERMKLAVLYVFLPVIKSHEKTKMNSVDQFIVVLCLFTGFVYNKKNIKYHHIYHLFDNKSGLLLGFFLKRLEFKRNKYTITKELIRPNTVTLPSARIIISPACFVVHTQTHKPLKHNCTVFRQRLLHHCMNFSVSGSVKAVWVICHEKDFYVRG